MRQKYIARATRTTQLIDSSNEIATKDMATPTPIVEPFALSFKLSAASAQSD
jgi:hypothetical protein